MVRWGNSLSLTFRCANWIRQGGQLSPLLYNVYTDDLNHHLEGTGVGCYVGGAWVNSLSYAVTALQTLGGMSRICRTPYAGPAKTITGSVLNKSQDQK